MLVSIKGSLPPNPQPPDPEQSRKFVSAVVSELLQYQNFSSGNNMVKNEPTASILLNVAEGRSESAATIAQGGLHTDIPVDANAHCPGTQSNLAGKSAACEGCPSQNACATAPKGADPDLPLIKERMNNVRHKILILSGKGGVGKSFFATHLAWALASNEYMQIGLMDIDICGPSVPKIMGCEDGQIHASGSGWAPIYVKDNLGIMSIGFMLPSFDSAVIWRAAKKNGMIKQFLKYVDWGELDYLIVDTPPGTSDEHLSITQYLKDCSIDGALVIATPQEVTLLDVRKELDFCRKVGIKILGLVENMSGFVCPNCRSESNIFVPTTGGAEALAKEMNVPFLGRVPLDPKIGKACDYGLNLLEEYPDSPAAMAFSKIINGWGTLDNQHIELNI